MRQSRLSGSVEGVMGNHDSYSDFGRERVHSLWKTQLAADILRLIADSYAKNKDRWCNIASLTMSEGVKHF